MTSTTDEELCEFTDIDRRWCTHCLNGGPVGIVTSDNHADGDETLAVSGENESTFHNHFQWDDDENRTMFPAQQSGQCPACFQAIRTGDPITRHDNEWVHVDCA